ncbi:KIR protein [Plasmodium knowlesi strain H]|uniref:KIR protein n=3 Tax=Plasmodium knowlesi TaxID=5850 RepID=A0A5K1UU91_PLAKH|nr:KIR protein [Plasmodium knowlesi strain H]OTN68025.1 KIR protein [Plasmodium knowlesi]CAA9986903.1 KIR protein [Plasmodium knowlesi strain H]SBO26537.1 KIR protein [Plasmodium knowlesi strain H]SBO28107.1 KIR protein [Plasmodium knowlesi strain H]VVS76377.1 KIR protein [Plasmodium knowlesi strain H]|eukprot:XP_002258148.1 KIR protein [Plasmodium knowlesi strain H]
MADSDQLPSDLRYDVFKSRRNETCTQRNSTPECDEQLIGRVWKALRKFQINDNDKKLAKDIVSNGYYACSTPKGGGIPEYSDLCHWFYYWLGDQMKVKLSGNTLSYTPNVVMRDIYQELGGVSCSEACTNLYDDISSWDTVEWAKDLFDYVYDINFWSGDQSCRNILSSGKYAIQFSGAKTAYDLLCEICVEDDSKNDKYCKKFKSKYWDSSIKKFKTWPPDNLPKLTCTEGASLNPGTLERGHLAILPGMGKGDSLPLPSELVYTVFDADGDCPLKASNPRCDAALIGNIGRKLGTLGIEPKGNLATVIVRNHYHACTQAKTVTADYYNYCHFLYYWLGDKIKNNFNGRGLHEAMQTVYGNLASAGKCNNNCTNLYPDMSKSNFDERKTIFDYAYNYTTSRKDGEGKKYTCSLDCDQYLQEVKEAYLKVKDSCNGHNTSNGRWCKEFTQEYRNYFDGDQPILTCKTECEPEPPTMKDLGILLSGGAYDEFNDNWRTYNGVGSTAALKSSLRNLLGRYLETSDCTDKVASAWYYMTDVMDKTHNRYYKDRCEYFYYWLGDLVSSKLKINGGTTSFSKAMNELYAALQKLPGSKGACPAINTSDNVDSALFNSRKKIFDFHRHYENIKEMLGRSGNQCNNTFGTYVDHTKSAYTAVEGDSGGSSNEYWNEFWKRHKGDIIGEITNLTCQPASPKKPSAGDDFDLGDAVVDGGNVELPKADIDVSGPKVDIDVPDVNIEGPEGKLKGPKVKGDVDVSLPKVEEAADGNSGSIVGSVSGGLATVGLPAVGFFLYKYTDVFDGIKKFLFGGLSNNTGGRNRGRGRRSTLRSDLNTTYSDHDYDGISTIGGSDSMSESITDTSNYSLPYTTSSYR